MEWTFSRGIGQHYLLIVMFLACFIRMARGNVLCMCNTPECRDRKLTRCIAKSSCYVEFIKEKERQRPLTRGCIDTRTPLNCERFLPQPNTKLLTYCCDNELCNNVNKMPRRPSRIFRKRPDSDDAKASRTPAITPSPRATDSYAGEKPGMLLSSMNPMHIAGPILAACIVLAMIIFVIFLIKRKESLESTDNLVYTDYDPALLAALANQPDRDDTVTPVLNPVLYNPFLKVTKSPV